MSVGFSHEYPPGEWTVERVARALRESDGASPLPRYEDGDRWARLRTDALTGPHVEAILADADEQRGEPVPRLPASTYLDFHRTGERYTYQDPESRRYSRLALFTLAECFEREGRYLDDVLDYAWAACEQTTWTVPAHLRGAEAVDGLPGVVDDRDRVVALYSSYVAALLSEVDHLLGERLHPALRERIRTEVDRRAITPYLARDDHPWMTPPASNWNAVCNCGVVLAALHALEDPERQARVVAKAARTLEDYLRGFDADGCTAEGTNYWSYGFGNYVTAAAELSARTDGELSLLSPSVVREIAEFPLRVETSPGRYLPFSDAEETTTVSPGVASRLGTALGVEGLGALGRRVLRESGPRSDSSSSMGVLRDLLWTREVPAEWERPTPERQRFFAGHQWWIARGDPTDPDGLVVAAKGGHNDESHNHNDCGSFVVHYRGESLLTDLGRPRYDRDYFVDAERYGYLTARSLGHSVPYVDGFEQAHGREYAADVAERESTGSSETISLELAGCYPADTELASLRRTVRLDRGSPGEVTVSDSATFASGAGEGFESVLVSYFPIAESADGLVVTGDRGRATVTPAPNDAAVEIERLPGAVNDRDVWRARVDPGSAGDDGPADVSLSLSIGLEPA